MKAFGSIFAMVRQNIRKWTANPRYLVLALFMLVTFWHQMEGMTEQAKEMEVGINALSLFPMLYSNVIGLGRLIMGAGVLILFCDAPFIDHNQQFVISRAGKGKFCIAQMVYIIVGSAIYTLFLGAAPCLFTGGQIGISGDWGTLFRSTVRGSDMILGNIVISGRMLEHYTVVEAFFYELSLFFLIAVFLGMIVYFFNLLVGRMSGIFVAGCILMLGVIPLYFPGENWIYWISPVSFAEITYLDVNGTTQYPSLGYAYSFLLAAIVLLAIGIYIVFQRSQLIVKEEI